jgi:DUF1680 family protein
MKKRLLILTLSLLMCLTAFFGCADTNDHNKGENGDGEEPILISLENPLKYERNKLLQFDFDDVTVQDGIYKDTIDSSMAFYFEGSDDDYSGLSADDILYRYRYMTGITPNPGRDLDWMTNTGHGAEHIVPQLISAAARYYAYTKADKDLQRCIQLADGFEQVGQKSKYMATGNSTYMYEKFLRGFMDLYEYAGVEKGYALAKNFVEHAMSTSPLKTPVKELGHNVGDSYNEWYTMSESLYEFADLAKRQGESAEDITRYRDYAKLYEYDVFWDMFYNDDDIFKSKPDRTGPFSEYFHAYSHANTFNSALQAYETTGKEYYLKATQNFYEFMRDSQILPTGGYGAHHEYLLPRSKQIEFLGGVDHDHTETQCSACALVNLANSMARYSSSARYGHWIESAFYNMTIASLETKNGFPFYYSSYNVNGGKKVMDSRRWMCCSGTRPLVVLEYLRSIYYNDTMNLYVNLFTNSSVKFTNANGNEIELTQQSSFPAGNTVAFSLNASETENYAISFRKPEWLSADALVSVNGTNVRYAVTDGWINIVRDWADGDKITLTLPKELYFSAIVSEKEEDKGFPLYALMDGPVVLACDGEKGGFQAKFLNDRLNINAPAKEQLTAVEGSPLTYYINENENLEFKPFYEYEENEVYYMMISTIPTL